MSDQTNTGSLGPAEWGLDAVLVERTRMVQGKFPDLELLDKIVLKNGPRAYKVAMHWGVLDRATGQKHHHAVTIETYRKLSGPGWQLDSPHSISLSDDGGDELGPLIAFLHAVRGGTIPEQPGRYLVVDADKYSLVSSDGSGLLDQMMDAHPGLPPAVAGKLLDWLSSLGNASEALEKLERLQIANLHQLSTLVGISVLRQVLGIWEAHHEDAREEFWQATLAEHAILFSQVFSIPVVIVQGKAYIGGKSIANKSGNLVDFLVKNALTENVALIELKTPMTPLIGREYRGDVFNVSGEITGAVLQVANYKASMLQAYTNLMHPDSGADLKFSAFDPRCLIIAGTLARDCQDHACRKSFELFRAALRDVQIVTFDELFGKIRVLLDVLEGRTATSAHASPPTSMAIPSGNASQAPSASSMS